MSKWVYYFGDGGKELKNLLGGKGANLSEMTKLGLVKTDNLKQLWRRLDFNGNNVVSLQNSSEVPRAQSTCMQTERT